MYYLQNNIINISQKLLYKLNQNNEINGIIVFILHCLIIGFFALNAIFGKVDHIYLFGILILLGVVFFHLLFRGCIFIKIERKLLDTKDWYGPWTFLFNSVEYYFNDKLSINLKNNIFICWGIIISTLLLLKIVFYN